MLLLTAPPAPLLLSAPPQPKLLAAPKIAGYLAPPRPRYIFESEPPGFRREDYAPPFIPTDLDAMKAHIAKIWEDLAEELQRIRTTRVPRRAKYDPSV